MGSIIDPCGGARRGLRGLKARHVLAWAGAKRRPRYMRQVFKACKAVPPRDLIPNISFIHRHVVLLAPRSVLEPPGVPISIRPCRTRYSQPRNAGRPTVNKLKPPFSRTIGRPRGVSSVPLFVGNLTRTGFSLAWVSPTTSSATMTALYFTNRRPINSLLDVRSFFGIWQALTTCLSASPRLNAFTVGLSLAAFRQSHSALAEKVSLGHAD